MGFGDLKTAAGLTALNNYLEDKSYIEGYVPSQADTVVSNGLSGAPAATYVNALRWYKHILSYGADKSKFPGVPKALTAYGSSAAAATPAGGDDDDEEIDLFGSDDEEDEVDVEAEKVRQERLAAYAAKKTKKPGPIAKSNIILDVKPIGDDTDLREMETLVREIEMDGLLWGTSKLIEIAYGIKKLRIACVVEDEKVSVDDIEEKIAAFEDHVQSTDIFAFNKV